MKFFTDRPKWKRIALAVICLAGLLAIAGGSFSAYTSHSFLRGVARNRDDEAVRFASNYMQNCATGTEPNSYPGKTVTFPENEGNGSLSLDLYIYNYASGNKDLVNTRDITYNLKIVFSGGKGTGYNVTPDKNFASTRTEIYTFQATMNGRVAREHKYTISFPKEDLNKLKITAVATPVDTSLSATNNQILAVVLAPCSESTTQTFVASGKFIDKSDSTNPSEYDGFNYEISISSGRSENATVTWSTDLVEIDMFFLKNLGKKDAEIKQILSDGKLVLTMDQAQGTGDYLIPFYIKDKSNEAWDKMTWDEMENVVSFSATQV